MWIYMFFFHYYHLICILETQSSVFFINGSFFILWKVKFPDFPRIFGKFSNSLIFFCGEKSFQISQVCGNPVNNNILLFTSFIACPIHIYVNFFLGRVGGHTLSRTRHLDIDLVSQEVWIKGVGLYMMRFVDIHCMRRFSEIWWDSMTFSENWQDSARYGEIQLD